MRGRVLLWTLAGALCVVAVVGAPDPETAAKRLGVRVARQREQAASELRADGAAARPALEAAATSSDPDVRSRARALLALLARDADSERRRDAELAVRDALRRDRGLEAGGPTDRRLASLEPESGDVLASAARAVAERSYVGADLACALVRHATPSSVATLAALVRDERVFPSSVLAASRELDALLCRDPQRAETLRGGAAAALDALREAMRSAHAPTRRVATALFGALAGDDGAETLVAMACDRDTDVRAEACRVAGVYVPAQTAATLRETAADPCSEVRTAALAALLAVPGTPHPEPAVAAATDRSATVRAAAATLLAREATPDTLCVLQALAADPSARVRAAARRALAAFSG
jgi:hypothetical protein